MPQTISMVFFVFAGFFGDVILKVGLMFPQDGQTLNPKFYAGPLVARHAKQDPPRRVSIFSCRRNLTRHQIQWLIQNNACTLERENNIIRPTIKVKVTSGSLERNGWRQELRLMHVRLTGNRIIGKWIDHNMLWW